jgi:hypothetical protein
MIKGVYDDGQRYFLDAFPETFGVTGNRAFFLDGETGGITDSAGVGLGITISPE